MKITLITRNGILECIGFDECIIFTGLVINNIIQTMKMTKRVFVCTVKKKLQRVVFFVFN